jgi:Ca2+-binding RTX toxin-like protein
VQLNAGGYVISSISGIINGGRYGISVGTAAGTIVNRGTVQSSGNEAISLDGGTLVNSGLVTMLANGGAVYLYSGTVLNSGTIEAGSLSGAVYIYNNGGVTNLASGTIIGGYGVGFSGGYANFVDNAGTIIGNNGTAVHFQLGGTNLLVDHPGAVFTGAIYGATGGTSVFELASGASTGTIAGFGGTVTNFTSLQFDAGAQWIVAGNDSANGLGTLGISGFAAGDTIDLTGFMAVTDTFGSNEVTFTNIGGTTETLNLQGSFNLGNLQFVADGSGGTDVFVGPAPARVYGQTIDQAGIVATSEIVANGTLTLFNGTSVTGAIFVGTSVNSGDFTLRTDGAGGTDVIVSTVFGTYASGVTLLTNPTTIASTARVGNAAINGSAITGPAGTAWTVSNYGAIAETGPGGIGIYLAAGGLVTNGGSGSISGAAYGVEIYNAAGTVQNSGTIQGIAGEAVYLKTGTVTNSGLVESGGSAAVYIYGTGGVTNLAGGTIAAANGYAVNMNGAGNVANAGTMAGSRGGVYGAAPLTVTNTGIILGTGADSAGVDLNAGGFVTNSASGVIRGAYGVYVHTGSGTIENSGTIQGTYGTGVYLASGTVLNSGLIEGNATYAAIYIGNGGYVTNLPGGTINGSYGVFFHGASNGTVNNSGTIIGTNGTAVSFGDGFNRLIDNPGAVFTGAIYGGGSANSVMELASGASAGTIAGFGGTVTNFGSLVFDTGAQWTVAGDDSANGFGTLGIAGFATGDTIDLTGFVAVSETFSSNEVTFTNSLGTTATLHLEGGFSSADLQFVSDGSGGSDIYVGPPLDVPPVITGTAGGQALNDNATDHPYSGVTITDASPGGQSETVTITVTAGGVASDADGLLSGASLTKTGVGTYVIAAASAAAATAELDALLFTPTAHQVVPGGTVTTGFTLSVTDTAAETASNSTASVITTAINNPPVITGTGAGQPVNDNATDEPFSTVTIADPDFGATETVTITLTSSGVPSDANGALSGTGLTRTGVGTYTLGPATPAVVTAELDALVFTPTAHEVPTGDSVTTGMTLSVTDGIAGSPTTDATTTAVTTAVGLPSLTGTVANQGVPNETPSNPFANVIVTGASLGATETVTVTLSTPGYGTLSTLSSGSYDASTGIYSVTGTPAVDTAALRALVFTPIEQPGADVTTTGFAISPGAGGAVDTVTSVTSVEQILGLGAVPVNQIAISVSPDGSDFAPAVAGMTNEAVVTDPVQGDTYAVPAGYQALFLGGSVSATLTDTMAGGAYLVGNSGNEELIAAAPNDILVPGSGNDSLIGGNFASTVVGGSGASTVFAGTGAMTVIEGSGPISFGGNGNAGSTVSGGTGPDASPLAANLTGQNQTVSVGSSAATITAGGSNNVVIGGSSTLNVTVSGTADTVQAGTGASTVVSGGSGAVITGSTVAGSGALVVNETGTSDTISGGAGAATVTDPTGTATFVIGGTGGLTFVGGTGTATVVGGTGLDSVTAGAGGVIFDAGTSTNATVNSGSGTATIFGAAGTVVNLTGTLAGSASQPNYVVAGPGGETLNAAGSGSADWLSVNTTVSSSATTMIAGSGNDTLVAGLAAGSTTMTGGAGSDAFVFFKQAVGGAHDVVNDFTASDSVYIEGYGAGSAAALQAASSVGSGGLTLTLSDGTTITFSNLTSQTTLNGRMQYG